MSKKKKHNTSWKGVVPRFLAFFFASALIVLALGAALFLAERDNRFQDLAELEQGRLRLQTDFVEREIGEVSSDLTALSRNGALGVALRFGVGEGESQLTREDALQLAQDIENFARAKGVYDQLLLHDRWERELLRMEGGGADPVVVFPELAAWETEPPPMTLDGLSTGRVRYWMPEDDGEHLYFATAVTHEDAILGSLVLVYRSSELLSMVGEQRDDSFGEFRILERSGRSLFAAASDGEAFDPARSAPGLWSGILAGEQGQAHDESGLTSFNTLAPGLLRRDTAGIDSEPGLDDWKLVSHVSAESLDASIAPYFRQLLKIYLGVLAVLAAGSLLLALGRTRFLQNSRKADADRDRYHRILDSARELVITASIEKDAAGGADLLGLNREAMELFGFDEDEQAQMSVGELVAESSQEDLRRHLAEARQGRAAMTELEMRDRNGGSHIIEIAFQRGSAEDGKGSVLRGAGRDVGHRKRTESELDVVRGLLALEGALHVALAGDEGKALSTRLIDTLAATTLPGSTGWFAIYRADAEGILRREVVRDEVAEAFLPAELPDSFRSSLGDQWSRHLDFGEVGDSPFADTPPSGQRGCWIHRLDAEAGGLLLVFTSARQAPADEGTALCARAARMLAWRLDHFAAADRLQEEQATARALQEEQSSAASHGDGCLLGLVERMRRQVTAHLDLLSRQAEGSVSETVSQAAWALRRSVEEVSSFARLESDELKTEQLPFAWREVLKASLGAVAPAAAEKGIALRAEIEKQIPAEVIGDATHLRQVLDQLLANAVVGTERGEVRMKVQLGREEPAGLALNFNVKDTGIGIPDEQLQNLFAGFAPGGPGLRDGRGLGLTLASRLVERMGGRLWVQSSAGEGSSFNFSAIFGDPSRPATPDSEPQDVEFTPVATPVTEPASSDEKVIPAPACSLRVLLAESNAKSRERLVGLIGAQGHDINAVDSGIAAVEAIAQQDYDVVLLAAQMNEMDGLTAARAIRDCGSEELPIVAMSAEATGGDRTRCEAAGMNHYLSKPIVAEELLELMNDIAGTLSPAAASASPDHDPDDYKETDVDPSIFDRAAAMDRVGDDLELLIELAGMFLEDCPDILTKIEAAVTAGDGPGLKESAHFLKGAVANFSAKQAYDAAFTLEQMGMNKDLTDAPQALGTLKQEIDRLAPILSGL
jgi:PAS domain S-box-containing protein